MTARSAPDGPNMGASAFSEPTRAWFASSFPSATQAQQDAWAAIAKGEHTLVVAPTGSGKTLAAFLSSIDRLMQRGLADAGRANDAMLPGFVEAASAAENRADDGAAPEQTTILYISPLKALAVDVERNLRAPLVGIQRQAERLGLRAPKISVGIRSGDTPPTERRRLIKHPPDILITTPESLFLMLTSKARDTLRHVDTVIVDEVHAIADTKRGAHLAVSLARLDALLESPAQRIGLSATVNPLATAAQFLGGSAPVTIVAPEQKRQVSVTVTVPVEDLTNIPPEDPPGGSSPEVVNDKTPNASWLPEPDDDADLFTGDASAGMDDKPGSIWPHIENAMLDLILEHRSTIVFVNSRGLAERLTQNLNNRWALRRVEIAATDEGQARPAQDADSAMDVGTGDVPDILVAAHHGSVSKEQRAQIENGLKAGTLPCVVATSSLELGIDMGLVDLVVQVAAPMSVASGLQRIGRANHHVGGLPHGVLYPKTRRDLLNAAVTAQRMQFGELEPLVIPQNPLDVLAQHTVAAMAMDDWDVDDWYSLLRSTAPYANMPYSAYTGVLDMVAGRYPSDDFAQLRPRVTWDRTTNTLHGRPGAQRLAVTSGGTIPDRGQFTVVLVQGDETKAPARVGELDEEMVYESRVTEVFALGTSSWRIQEITHDRVIVTPAAGQPAKLPFWHGDGPGRPKALGEAIGAFTRKLDHAKDDAALTLAADAGLDESASRNLVSFIADQRESTGVVPTDRRLVVERTKDELGDWRVVLHSPYGRRVHAPWALAVTTRIHERYGIDGNVIADDDGIIVRMPDTDDDPPGAELFTFDPDELSAIVHEQVGASALFASRFRECAARALLLPKRTPGARAPLWQQRQRAAQLLEVAQQYTDFPILLETARECLQDVYDVPGLLELMRAIAAHSVLIADVTTEDASPFAQSLLFGYVAAFMYEGDGPSAERRAAALQLDQDLLGDLLGRTDLRDLLDPEIIRQVEAQLQHVTEDTRFKRDAEDVADLLRLLGPLSTEELATRTYTAADSASSDAELGTALEKLDTSHRAIRVHIAGVERWAAIEDASRLRDALGTPLPGGIPSIFLEPVDDPIGDILRRYARTHGPFTVARAASRFGLGTQLTAQSLQRLSSLHPGETVTEGLFTPQASAAPTSEWISQQVLRRIRHASLLAAQQLVEPVDHEAFARFLPAWQFVGSELRGEDGIATVFEQLAGVPLPASAWESLILPSRVHDATPPVLDALLASGNYVWWGDGAITSRDGWIAFAPRDLAEMSKRPLDSEQLTADDSALLEATQTPTFGQSLLTLVGPDRIFPNPQVLAATLERLLWGGWITSDTFHPVRSLLAGAGAHRRPKQRPSAHFSRAQTLTRSAARRAMAQHRADHELPPWVAGRWTALANPSELNETPINATQRALVTTAQLIDRYGVLTKGAVEAEHLAGGFGGVYQVARRMEDEGTCVRGYFIAGLGGAQFSTSDTVDRLRNYVQSARDRHHVLVLAATDPANAYGQSLPWPPSPEGVKARPGRKAGALVVLDNGNLVLYLERGGKTAISWTSETETGAEAKGTNSIGADALHRAASAVASLYTARHLGRLTIEQYNGEPIMTTDAARIFGDAGFSRSPKGMRLHA